MTEGLAGKLLRLNSIRVLAVLVICIAAVWAVVSWQTEPKQVAVPKPSGPVITTGTTLQELPPITGSSASWSGIQGVNATVALQDASVIPGEPALKLVALTTDGSHFVDTLIGSLNKNSLYTISVWLKPAPQADVFIQAHDQKPTNYGLVVYDLADKKISIKHGDVVDAAVVADQNGWLKLTLALRTADDVLDVMIGFADPAGSTTLKGDGQSALLFGGVAVAPKT